MGAELCEYILAFCCLNCSRHEAVATFLSDTDLLDDDMRMRILQAQCNCGWRSEVCGAAANSIKIDPDDQIEIDPDIPTLVPNRQQFDPG